MKISIFVVAILCLPLNILLAQHTTNLATAQSTLDQAFSYIDNFDTPSGILYGQSKQTILLDYYKSYSETDSIYHNQFTHNLIAKTLCENTDNERKCGEEDVIGELGCVCNSL